MKDDNEHRTRKRRLSKGEEEYAVAKLLCEKGLGAAAIARELYANEYWSGKAGQSRTTNRVKSLIGRALRDGIISLRYVRGDLRQQLETAWGGVTFAVVDDAVPKGGVQVYQEAARLVAQRIDELMAGTDRRIVIANAGGLALSRLTEYLPAFAPHYPDAADRLLFIALNALRRADSYHLSANFVAVRMAAIFGGRHLAKLKASTARAAYEGAFNAIDLLVCGAGSPAGFLPEWLHDADSPSQASDLPPEVVGDLCLIPLDQLGQQVKLEQAAVRRIETELLPRPTYKTLRKLAAEDKVLVVLAVADDDPKAVSLKIPIAQAILKPPLTKWCVLGSSLAEALHKSIGARGTTVSEPPVEVAAAKPVQRRGPRLPKYARRTTRKQR